MTGKRKWIAALVVVAGLALFGLVKSVFQGSDEAPPAEPAPVSHAAPALALTGQRLATRPDEERAPSETAAEEGNTPTHPAPIPGPLAPSPGPPGAPPPGVSAQPPVVVPPLPPEILRLASRAPQSLAAVPPPGTPALVPAAAAMPILAPESQAAVPAEVSGRPPGWESLAAVPPGTPGMVRPTTPLPLPPPMPSPGAAAPLQ